MMEASELIKRIKAYGVDEKGLKDRFAGNDALYASCFEEFIDEGVFDALKQSISEKNYAQAFEHAHALKGLSGNLGLTKCYDAICMLVESLRAKQYDSVTSEYAEVERQLTLLKNATSDAPAAPDAVAEPQPAGEKKERIRKPRERFFIIITIAMLVFIALVGVLLSKIMNDYQRKMTRESADHLIEISDQIKLYIEERVTSDWNTAGSIGDTIAYSNLVDNDQAIFAILTRQRDRWNVTDIQLFTENGYAVCSDGAVEPNGSASDIAARAMDMGKYLAIIDSNLIYTIPVETDLRYRGSRIVAVSVIQDMSSFLDNMDFAAFDGKARMYLTEESGIVLSKLSSENAITTFNIKATLRQRWVSVLKSELTVDDLMTYPDSAVFLTATGTERDYVVSTPIVTETTNLRLFFVAPTDVVNKTMSGFSLQLSLLCLMTVGVIVAFVFLAFMFLYNNRKRRFTKDIQQRERMFDLLVKHTQTALGLFTANQATADYLSTNCKQITGGDKLTLCMTDGVYRIEGEGSVTGDITLRMKEWDGRSVFRSGYMPKPDSEPASYFHIQLFPTDDEGQSYVCIMQDVTLVFEREIATKNALEMADRANEAKSRFLSNMSHDIRTPMNAIVNMTNFALDSLDQPKRLGQYLQTIRESSDHLLSLINDVLDMSRIESGQIVVESAPFDLREEMTRQMDMVAPLSNVKHQTFIANFDGVHTQTVLGDKLKFSQIIMNLLSNAVKFTPEKGAVRFTAVELPSLREDMVDVRITIEDNGIGISQENLRHVFEPFNRANDRQVSMIEGTGLGLSICRSYVTAMGGTIRCESEEGEGSVFIVELFFQKADAVQKPVESSPVLPGAMPFLGKHCLLAEDNPTNQIIARTMLERLGFLIDVANNGSECVQKMMSSPPNLYDAIYMDIQMPVMDGYQAAIAIRECSHVQAKTIPIIAMTANVFAEDIEKARIAGMDGHLSKPLSMSKLVEETYLAMLKRKGENL